MIIAQYTCSTKHIVLFVLFVSVLVEKYGYKADKATDHIDNCKVVGGGYLLFYE